MSDQHPLDEPGAVHLDPLTLFHQDIVTVTRVSGKRPWKPNHVGLPPAGHGLQRPLTDDEIANIRSGFKSQRPSREYTGDEAANYDKERESQPKWKRENEIVRELLQGFPPGTTVLDCPVGTGRFISLYESMGFLVQGIDKSEDMLRQAQGKATTTDCFFSQGDATSLNVDDKGFDVSLCIRLFRWITLEQCAQVLKELQRVTRKRIILNTRTEKGHQYARPKSFIEENLDGWAIVREDEIEPGFIMFTLEPV